MSSDLTKPLLGVVVISRLWLDIAYLYIKFDYPGLSQSGDIFGAKKILMGHVTVTIPRQGWFSSVAYWCAKFVNCSFSLFRNMIGTAKN